MILCGFVKCEIRYHVDLLKTKKRDAKNYLFQTTLGRTHSAINISMLVIALVNPVPDDNILDWSKLKQIADGILKCI